MSADIEMPKYQSHKQVHALKLKAVALDHQNGVCELAPEDDSYGVIVKTAEWYGSKVKEGLDPGYYVVYKDGYTSWSPTEAFEDGYRLVKTVQEIVEGGVR